jgi:hypothetical protein
MYYQHSSAILKDKPPELISEGWFGNKSIKGVFGA